MAKIRRSFLTRLHYKGWRHLPKGKLRRSTRGPWEEILPVISRLDEPGALSRTVSRGRYFSTSIVPTNRVRLIGHCQPRSSEAWVADSSEAQRVGDRRHSALGLCPNSHVYDTTP